jgi:hypothetical protein
VASKNFDASVLSQISSIGMAKTKALIERKRISGLPNTGDLENAIQITGRRCTKSAIRVAKMG